MDAAERRIVTHNLTDWSGDMGWMTAYFSVGAWTGILLMFAPRFVCVCVCVCVCLWLFRV